MWCFFYGFPKPTTHHSIRWHCWFCVGIKTPGNDLRCLPVIMQKQQNVQRASIAQIPDSVTGVSEVVFSPQFRYTKQVCTKNFLWFSLNATVSQQDIRWRSVPTVHTPKCPHFMSEWLEGESKLWKVWWLFWIGSSCAAFRFWRSWGFVEWPSVNIGPLPPPSLRHPLHPPLLGFLKRETIVILTRNPPVQQNHYNQYWPPPSSSQGFQSTSSISISIRISIKISISISISISITHPLLICFCIPPNSLCYGENGRPRDEDTLRRVYSLVPMSLSIKHRKNCECCPVSQLIVR